jgi:hypothetical protein
MNVLLKMIAFSLLVSMATFAGGGAMAYEEPRYDIVSKADGYEVRKYYDRVAAQITKASSSNKAFRMLFGYISGANRASEKVSMTIPVTQSEKIDMTVPVTQGEGDYMRFFLPANYTLETAPIPTDPAVEIVLVKGGYFAVHSYSGRANDRNFEDARLKLLEQLSRDGFVATSDVIRATYNGPFTLPFKRRNEAMVEINWP